MSHQYLEFFSRSTECFWSPCPAATNLTFKQLNQQLHQQPTTANNNSHRTPHTRQQQWIDTNSVSRLEMDHSVVWWRLLVWKMERWWVSWGVLLSWCCVVLVELMLVVLFWFCHSGCIGFIIIHIMGEDPQLKMHHSTLPSHSLFSVSRVLTSSLLSTSFRLFLSGGNQTHQTKVQNVVRSCQSKGGTKSATNFSC